MHSDHFAIGADSPDFSWILKPPPIPNGYLALETGYALVAATIIMHQEKNARSAGNQRR
jgi:hypothetical protein